MMLYKIKQIINWGVVHICYKIYNIAIAGFSSDDGGSHFCDSQGFAQTLCRTYAVKSKCDIDALHELVVCVLFRWYVTSALFLVVRNLLQYLYATGDHERVDFLFFIGLN